MALFDMDESHNLLVQAMSLGDRALLQPRVERVPLAQDQVLMQANQPIGHVYFPESGIVSLTTSAPGEATTEVGIAGREGFLGTAVLLGTDRTPHETFVQVGNGEALRIGADDFRAATEQSAPLRSLLLRYVQAYLVQSGASTASSANHRMETRLARWLLMCHDRVDGDELKLTHEFMSMMICAQRTGVTVCLHILEGAGMIRSKRARVQIVDREKLEELAGDAYGLPEAEYRRLIGPFGRSAAAR